MIFGYVELSFSTPIVQEWVVNTGRESTVKSFLRGHQKSGPFLEDNDSAIRVKRLSGLKSVSSKDKVQVITKAIVYYVSFILFFVFGFWSLLVMKLRKYENIT